MSMWLYDDAREMEEFQNYRPKAIVSEFRRVVQRELDFRREVRHMEEFRRDFTENPAIHIPHPYPKLSTSRVLVMELVEGIKLSENERLAAEGIDAKLLKCSEFGEAIVEHMA